MISGGLQRKHYATGLAIVVLALIVENVLVFGFGVFTGERVSQGTTAARPGISLIPGTRPVAPQTEGLGGAAARSDLAAGEGLGSGYCASHGGFLLRAHFRDVFACGPPTGASNAFDSVGYQCVELSVRYIWARNHRYVSNVPDGAELVSVAHAETGIPVGHPGVHRLPHAGDPVSLSGGPSADAFGHTGIVTRVGVDAQGNGEIRIMEENGSATGWDRIDVRHWVESYGDPRFAGGEFFYNHVSWLELVRPHKTGWLWTSWTHAHHRTTVPYKGKRYFRFWKGHKARLGAPKARPVFHHRRHWDGFEQMSFTKHRLFWWVHHPKWGFKVA